MYYWGLANIFKKTENEKVFKLIVEFLAERFQDEGIPENNFTAGLRIAGVIGHACKYLR